MISFRRALLHIAAAIAFCAMAPQAYACNMAPLERVQMTPERIERLEEIARIGSRNYDPDAEYGQTGMRDEWRLDRRGDCEDRVLWALGELGDMQRAARPVLILEARDRHATRRYAHVVLAVFGADGEAVVIDARSRRLRRLSEYENDRYAPRDSVGGAWERMQ